MEFTHLPYIPLRITSPYGRRDVSGIKGATSWHDGVDIGRDKSKYPSGVGASGNVYAVDKGTVIVVKQNNARGKYIIIKHNEIYQTLYQHLHSTNVSVGDVVNAGDVIGQMGNTGVGNATHLHFELRKNNKPIDPMDFLQKLLLKKTAPANDLDVAKIQKLYNFSKETMEFLKKYKYADILLKKWLTTKPQQIDQKTKDYILTYKYGREILRKVYGENF